MTVITESEMNFGKFNEEEERGEVHGIFRCAVWKSKPDSDRYIYSSGSGKE